MRIDLRLVSALLLLPALSWGAESSCGRDLTGTQPLSSVAAEALALDPTEPESEVDPQNMICIDSAWSAVDESIPGEVSRLVAAHPKQSQVDGDLTCIERQALSPDELNGLASKISNAIDTLQPEEAPVGPVDQPVGFTLAKAQEKRQKTLEALEKLESTREATLASADGAKKKEAKPWSNGKIMLVSSALYTVPEAIAVGYYYATQPSTRENFGIKTLAKSMTTMPGKDPGGTFDNFVGHPIKDGEAYALARQLGASWKTAWLYSALESVAWKTFKGEGWYAVPVSKTDLLTGLVSGPIVGEPLYQASKWLRRKDHNKATRLLGYVITPFAFVTQGMNVAGKQPH